MVTVNEMLTYDERVRFLCMWQEGMMGLAINEYWDRSDIIKAFSWDSAHSLGFDPRPGLLWRLLFAAIGDTYKPSDEERSAVWRMIFWVDNGL